MKHKMLVPIEKNIEFYAGNEVSQQVMEGSEAITEKTNKKKTALWTKNAIDRLDASVDEKTRIQIMNSCGANCASINKRVIAKAVQRRKKFQTLQEFLAAEEANPPKGTKIQLEDDVVIQIYTPHEHSYPMRCYCALLRYLPSDVTASPTYCRCSEGFIKKYWETVTGHPVEVTLLESAVSGSSQCKFKVKLNFVGEQNP
jgi:hypothetical protein